MEEKMLTENTEEIMQEVVPEDAKTKRKRLKKDIGHMAWGMVIYQLIYQLISSIILVIILSVITTSMIASGEATIAESEAYYMSMLENEAVIAGMSFIFGVIGIGFLFLYFRKRINEKQMFASHKKMGAKEFLAFLCLIMGVQLLSDPIFMGMEWLFNLLGYTMESSLLAASAGSTTVIMVLFAVVGAPVFEEIIYRGFAMNVANKYGKVFAIVISAVLFGVMHMNIPQAVFAFMMGIVLGYVAMEYSLGWAIAFHLINNGFGEAFVFLTKDLGENTQTILYYVIVGVFALGGVICLLKNRKAIAGYIAENKPEKKSYLYAFTTVGMIVFIVGCLALGFTFIEAL